MYIHLCLCTDRFTLPLIVNYFARACLSISAGIYCIFQQVSLLFKIRGKAGKKFKELPNCMICLKSLKSVLPFQHYEAFHILYYESFLEYWTFSSEEKPTALQAAGKLVCLGLQPRFGIRNSGMPFGMRSSQAALQIRRKRSPLCVLPRCLSALSWELGVAGDGKPSGFWPNASRGMPDASKTILYKTVCK